MNGAWTGMDLMSLACKRTQSDGVMVSSVFCAAAVTPLKFIISDQPTGLVQCPNTSHGQSHFELHCERLLLPVRSLRLLNNFISRTCCRRYHEVFWTAPTNPSPFSAVRASMSVSPRRL